MMYFWVYISSIELATIILYFDSYFILGWSYFHLQTRLLQYILGHVWLVRSGSSGYAILLVRSVALFITDSQKLSAGMS